MSETAARGILLGAAVGDALGWPQELRGGLVGGKKARHAAEPTLTFRDWTRNGGYRAHRYPDPVRAGEYSDDTQLLMAVARACLTGDGWLGHLTSAELPTWPLYQRGGGGAVLKAASRWADGHPPWEAGTTQRAAATVDRYRGAGANGVAMRIAPHVCWADTAEDLTTRIVFDGLTTHGHPRALIGALAYGSALRHAATSSHTLEFGELVDAAAEGIVDSAVVMPMLPGTGEALDGYADLWDKTNAEMAQLLDTAAASLRRGAVSAPNTTLADLGCTNTKVNGAGTITAAGAIYLASRFGSRPDGAILTAAYLPDGDTDTLASMTGALLGAVHGADWIPDPTLEQVQDREYLAALAVRSAARDVTAPTQPRVPPSKFRTTLLARINHGGDTGVHDFPDGRKADLTSVDRLAATAQRATLRLDDGQMIFIDLLESAPTSPRPEPATADDTTQRRRDGRTTPKTSNGDATAGQKQSHARTATEQPATSPSGTATVGRPGPTPDTAPGRGQTAERDTAGRPSEYSKARESGVSRPRDSAATADRRPPVDSNRITKVALPSWNLSRCAAFYARLLDRDLTIRDRSVQIAPTLYLVDADSGTATSQITLVVSDLRAAAARVGTKLETGAKTLALSDPDGRQVRVTE